MKPLRENTENYNFLKSLKNSHTLISANSWQKCSHCLLTVGILQILLNKGKESIYSTTFLFSSYFLFMIWVLAGSKNVSLSSVTHNTSHSGMYINLWAMHTSLLTYWRNKKLGISFHNYLFKILTHQKSFLAQCHPCAPLRFNSGFWTF